MTNKINGKQIVDSIEMKEKWAASILKKSRKTTSLEKFWELVKKELGLLSLGKLDRRKVFIGENFLEKLKESDRDFENCKEYETRSPKTTSDIEVGDFSVYLLEGWLK